MKRFGIKRAMSDNYRSQLDVRVAEAEKRTGAQIVLSVIDRCDNYPELPWKAFALGVVLTSLALIARDIFQPVWISGASVLIAVVLILAVGALCALLCVFTPGFSRFFLDQERSEVEVRQYAESLFLDRELFATSQRTGILLLVGLFERQVVILPDTGLEDRLGQVDLNHLIDTITQTLASGRIADALEQGLTRLENALSGTKPVQPQKNELPDEIIEEEGS